MHTFLVILIFHKKNTSCPYRNTQKLTSEHPGSLLLINDDTILEVDEPADKEDAPVMTDVYPIFEWMPGIPVTDEPTDNHIDESEANVDEQHDNTMAQ